MSSFKPAFLICAAIVLVSTSAQAQTLLRDVLQSWFPGLAKESVEPADENAQTGTPAAFGALLSPATLLNEEQLKNAVEWQAPNFAKQALALGWSETTFATPPLLKERVAFWKDIYARYTTSQGVLHDPVSLFVYDSVDFATATARSRERLIDDRRNEIVARLMRLQDHLSKNGTAEGLVGEDLRYWKSVELSLDPLRFIALSARVRFQLGQKDRFLLGIYYSGRYLREMEAIFREEGLPIELTRLPFVESSFNVNARSKVGASGIWQFMPRTARSYMKVNKEIDERNDPIISTRAAARMLRNNYQMLRSWPLALTGYNHGPTGVRNVVQKLGTDDIAQIVANYSSRTFGFASQNFYACFLAALEVEREAKTIFSEPKWNTELDSSEIKTTSLSSWSTLVKFFDGDENLAAQLNPHLLARARDARPRIPSGTRLRIPPARLELAKKAFAGRMSPSNLAKLLKDTPMAAMKDVVNLTPEEPKLTIEQVFPGIVPPKAGEMTPASE